MPDDKNFLTCSVGSIAEVHQRLVAEGYHITEYALRLWVKTGQVDAVYSGRKAFVSYRSVLRFLREECGEITA